LHTHRLNRNDSRSLQGLWDEYNPDGFLVHGIDEKRLLKLLFRMGSDATPSIELVGITHLFEAFVPALESPFLISRNALPRGPRPVLRCELGSKSSLTYKLLQDNLGNTLVIPKENGIWWRNDVVIALEIALDCCSISFFRTRTLQFLSEQADLPDESNAINRRRIK
jgi:hypothetical protein